MARVDLATGLFLLLAWSTLLFTVSAHPPQSSSSSSAAGTSASFKQGRQEVDPWHRHGERFDDDDLDLVQDDWSVGFGRRLSVIQRRQGSAQEQFKAQLRPKAEATSTTTTTTSTTTTTATTTTAVPIVSKAETPTGIVRLIRKRLPENRSPSPLAPTSGALGKLVNATVVNETVQPTIGEVTEESFVSAETAIVETRESVANKVAAANLSESPQPTITSSTTTTTTTTSAPASTTLAAVTSSTTTATTTTTTAATVTTLSPSNKPPWRVRMELNQSNRRGQSTTAKPTLIAVEATAVSSALSEQSISTTTSSSPAVQQEILQEVKNSSNVPAVIPSTSTAPLLESSQLSESFPSSTVAVVVTSTTNAPNSRPIQSSRISITSSLSPPPPSVLWTPIVRLPITGSRNIPAGTLKIQITSTRLPPLPAASSTPNPKLLESVDSPESDSEEEENVVKTALSSSTTSGRIFPPTTTTKPTTTTTTEAPTTTSKSSTTRRAPPTPIMHTLEDILQRLVPARDHDNFGGSSNPFLVPPVAYYPTGAVVPPTADDTNEIVSIGAPVLRASTGPTGSSKTFNDNLQQDRNHNATSGNGGSNWNDSNKENQAATTSIYVVGVVAVIPLAGLVLWIVRVQLHKRRERLNESETSSETGFRKRLPPVALTPSKHARLFYGANDKEDLVSGAVSLGNSGGGGPGGGKSSPSPSPWEFTRSRLRLQTLIGEGNFGQVWKAEAEDICGCQGTLLVAVKTVKDGAAAKEKQELLREMRIMQQVGPHPNVVALLGCCTEQEPFLLIMEYVMYGRLLTFLRDHRTHQTYYNYSTDSESLTSRDLTTFAYCVAKGMEYIYSKGVVHRDLAARNVLVDHNKLCKVADFGLSRSVRDSAGEMYEQRVKGALPIRWMAPESLIQSVFTQKSDIWSFGILVWEIVTLGSTPYPGMEAREVMRRVKDGHRLERPSHCRPEFYRLMSRCWHSDPQRRPDFGELKSELGQLLDDADGYIDLDSFQESIYVPLQSPSDESEKI